MSKPSKKTKTAKRELPAPMVFPRMSARCIAVALGQPLPPIFVAHGDLPRKV